MSPPRAIEMPSAITGLPWSRTFTCGGSMVPRLISAMSPSFSAAPPARIGKHPQLLERIELAGDAHLDRIARQIDRAARLDRVLLAELGEDLVEVEAELREAPLRDLDEDLLVLGAEDRDLADVLDLQQALAHPVGVLLQLGVAEAVGRERVDRAVDVAELVVEERPADARRQRAAHVADLLPHRVPDLRHLLRRRRVAHLEQDQRLARLRIAADAVRVRHLLQRLLELVGDLLGDLLRRRARPEDADRHGAEGERRVLVLAELEVRGEAEREEDDEEVARQRPVLERPGARC